MRSDTRLLLERRLLGALCTEARNASIREAASMRLGGYAWADAAHQAIFLIVMNFPFVSGAGLRDQLPARLTRRGFPDFEFDVLYSGAPPTLAEAEQWMAQLIATEI